MLLLVFCSDRNDNKGEIYSLENLCDKMLTDYELLNIMMNYCEGFHG